VVDQTELEQPVAGMTSRDGDDAPSAELTPPDARANERTLAERILMWLMLGGIALGCGFVLRPFFSAIVWAAILVFASWPVFRHLRRAGLGRAGAAGIMVALTAVLVVLPIAVAVPGSAEDVNHLRTLLQNSWQSGLPLAPSWLADVPVIGSTLTDLWNGWAADLSVMVAFFRPYFGMIAEGGLRLLLDIADSVLGFVLALFIGFFFYLYGESMAGRLQAIVRRIAGEHADRLIAVTGHTVRGTVYGILGTAIVQGLLTFGGLWLAGVPRAPLLGLVAGFLSVLPIGAPLVWIPAAVWLMVSGHLAWGIFLAIYGVVLISGADHLIRPYFISRGAQLPFLLTVLGVLGGVLAFGLLGIFLGPVLLGVGFTLVNEFALNGEAKPIATGLPQGDRS
jgi:predicted PurR-regulated permease PerM